MENVAQIKTFSNGGILIIICDSITGRTLKWIGYYSRRVPPLDTAVRKKIHRL